MEISKTGADCDFDSGFKHAAFKVLMGPLGREIKMATEGGILEVRRIVWEVNCSKGRCHVKMLLRDLKEGKGRKKKNLAKHHEGFEAPSSLLPCTAGLLLTSPSHDKKNK